MLSDFGGLSGSRVVAGGYFFGATAGFPCQGAAAAEIVFRGQFVGLMACPDSDASRRCSIFAQTLWLSVRSLGGSTCDCQKPVSCWTGFGVTRCEHVELDEELETGAINPYLYAMERACRTTPCECLVWLFATQHV